MKERMLALLDKEWSDVLKNRYVLYMMILLPGLFVLIPSAMLFSVRAIPMSEADLARESGEMPPGMAANWEGATALEQLQAGMAGQFTLFFLIIPLAIPMTIATYSVIGEKRDRSLE